MVTYFSGIDKYFPKGEQYDNLAALFSQHNNAFVSLDFDTEYRPQNMFKIAKPQPRLLCSTQVACLSQDPKIFSDQPRHNPYHPVSDLLGYLDIKPSNILWGKTETKKTLTLVVASHFQTVELGYIFRGVMGDIWVKNYLSNPLFITTTKRVMVNPDLIKNNPSRGLDITEFYVNAFGYDFTIAIVLVDTIGLQGQATYKDLLTNSNLPVADKDLKQLCQAESGLEVLPYEPIENMDRVIIDYPNSYDKYAVNDLRLWDILQANHNQMLQINESLGIPKDWSKVTPLTSGAAVSNTLRFYIAKSIGLDFQLNPKTGKNKNQTVLNKLLKSSPNTIFQQAIGTDALLVKTFGGRCVNNRPTVSYLEGVLADADEDGCYGNGQKHQIFPLGSPDILAYPLRDNVEYKTLRQWLKEYQSELVPGVWHCIVDTQGYKLKHKQDFIASWVANQKAADYVMYKRLAQQLLEADNSDDITYSEVDFTNEGQAKILLNEIRCGVLTHDILEWILKTASKHQRSELLDNLKVISSCVFLASQRCTDFKDYKTKLKAHDGKIKQRKIKGGSVLIDKTSRLWFSVPLAEKMHTLTRMRKIYPKSDPKLGGKRHPLNDRYKLVINTTYGVTASSYFDVSCSVVGNNITARARAMGWYMEKATQAFGIITDGSVFDLNKVVLHDPSRPLTGSNCIDGVDSSKHKLGPIGGQFWRYSHTAKGQNYFYRGETLMSESEVKQWLNTEGLPGHIKTHFPDVDCISLKWVDIGYKAENYQLKAEFEVPMEGYFAWEMKGIYKSISYHGTSDYQLTDFNGKTKTKMRSYDSKTHWDKNCKRSDIVPSEAFLGSLSSNLIPVPDIYLKESIVKLSEFQALKDKYMDNNLAVGDTIIDVVMIKPLSLSQFKYQTVKQLEAWKKQQVAVSGKKGWYLEGLFYDPKTGLIDYQAMIAKVYQMISEGVLDPLKHMGVTINDIPVRPNFELYLDIKKRVSVVKLDKSIECPKCGSTKVISKGTLPSGSTRHQCKSCTSIFSLKPCT